MSDEIKFPMDGTVTDAFVGPVHVSLRSDQPSEPFPHLPGCPGGEPMVSFGGHRSCMWCQVANTAYEKGRAEEVEHSEALHRLVLLLLKRVGGSALFTEKEQVEANLDRGVAVWWRGPLKDLHIVRASDV